MIANIIAIILVGVAAVAGIFMWWYEKHGPEAETAEKIEELMKKEGHIK